MKNTLRLGKMFKDIYGQEWKIIKFIDGDPILWNINVGEGLWDNGINLIEI